MGDSPSRMGMQVPSNVCPLYNSPPETMVHALKFENWDSLESSISDGFVVNYRLVE